MLRETLEFLELTNRSFGGRGVVLGFLSRWLEGRNNRETPVRILDVGTGGADIPRAIALWARRRGLPVHITALELMPHIADIARKNTREFPEVLVRQEDFLRLPPGETFDYVTASLFLHHMPDESLVPVLRAFDRLARRGVIVSDLLRSLPAYWSVKTLSRLAGNRVVRHDGPVSVRRAFTTAELQELAGQAGLHYLKARRHPWFRLSLAGEKEGAAV